MPYRTGVAATLLIMITACTQAPPGPEPADTSAATTSAPPAFTPSAGIYVLDPTHAVTQWSIRHNGMSNYTARFDEVRATIQLDPANIAASRLEVSIDPLSVNANYPADYVDRSGTGFKSWNEEMAKSARFLNAGAYPKITFISTAVASTGPKTADVTGDLTFLGQTRLVVLKATFTGGLARHPFAQMPAVGFAAEGTFKPSDFGLVTAPLGDVVTLRFDGEFIQKPADAPAS